MYADALATIGAVAGALGVATGAGLLVAPRSALSAHTRLRRWLLETDLITLLNRRRAVERPLYRHHRAFGVAVIVGSIAWLVLLWRLREHPLLTSVPVSALGPWGARVVVLIVWGLAVFALVIGVFLLIRPSALKGVEAAANLWFEPFPSDRGSGSAVKNALTSRIVAHAPRLTGLVLLAAGLTCLGAVSA